jgi:uncharacterized protein (TIGR02453 family)
VTFQGWPAEALEFYEGLEADNSRTFWNDHKEVYETCVAAPMLDLLDRLEDEFGQGRVFRPYRDVRFSADKSPYKTAIGATLAAGGYIQLSADGLAVAGGYHHLAPDQLDRYRQAAADDRTGRQLLRAISTVEKRGPQVRSTEQLKTAPRGYPKDHPRVELLRHKNLYAWQEWPPESWLGTPAAERYVVDALHAIAPLRRWLDEHVGDSTAPARR